MGRKNINSRVPQRSRLIANREQRAERCSHAFAIFRPMAQESADEVYERLRMLQQDDDIPDSMKLFSNNLHASIIQERRMRKSLAKGYAAMFTVGNVLGHIESGLPGRGRGSLEANFTGVDVIGRNHNIMIGHIKDEEGILKAGRLSAKAILNDLGHRMEVDNKDHVTLGVAERGGLSQTERRHVIHTAEEMICGLTVVLEPVVVEHNCIRVPLSDFRGLVAE